MKWLVFVGILLLVGLPQIGKAQMKAEQIALLKAVEAPGVMHVQDSLFMDETEVANIHWLEYLHFIKRDSSVAFYQSQLPDTTLWTGRLKVKQDTLAVTLGYYLRHPAFHEYPVVGVSYQQALNYCRWRTAVVNSTLYSTGAAKPNGTPRGYQGKHRKQLRGYRVSVEYRLPTVTEWEAAAAGGLDPAAFHFGVARPPVSGTAPYRQALASPKEYAACGLQAAIPPGEPVFRMEFNVQEKFYLGTSGRAFRCSPVRGFDVGPYRSGQPNTYGLYNMIGNVAEMTATEGAAKGGAFAHSIRDFTLRTNFRYDKPQEWLGFRCAATVRVQKK